MDKKSFFKYSGMVLPLAISFLLSAMSVDALQIVYPKSTNHRTYANSVFFVGNTTKGSVLKINGKEIKIYENGAFVEVVQLKDGINNFTFESKNETEKETTTYTIKKEQYIPAQTKQEQQLVEFNPDEYLYVTAIRNNIPLREQPNNNGKRITHISKDTVLMINGKKGNYYRVSLTPEKNLWVLSENVVNYSSINTKMLANISDVVLSEDKFYTYITTKMSFPVPYVIKETDNGLNLDLYNINEHPADTKFFKSTDTIKNFAINNISSDNQSTYFIELNDKLWGYEAYYEGNNFILKIRKTPQIDEKRPLKNITIAIDPGHGGIEAGAIGPTCAKEKDINLDISQKLKTLLEDEGANVIMTRNDDTEVNLYDRVNIAKNANALIFLSIHANSLPDGANPFVKHGTSTFYYNKESKELAQTIKNSLVKDLELRDDGTHFGNFAVTRTSMPLAVLIETAYMINPEEYSLLLDEDFREKAANSIKSGLKTYLLNSIKKN